MPVAVLLLHGPVHRHAMAAALCVVAHTLMIWKLTLTFFTSKRPEFNTPFQGFDYGIKHIVMTGIANLQHCLGSSRETALFCISCIV